MSLDRWRIEAGPGNRKTYMSHGITDNKRGFPLIFFFFSFFLFLFSLFLRLFNDFLSGLFVPTLFQCQIYICVSRLFEDMETGIDFKIAA